MCGVSLHSAAERDALQPQDGLYTVVRLGAAAPPQVVGALREVLAARERPEAVLARLAAPSTHSVLAELGEAGVTLTSDVLAHERAKLRLLNGAHSTLAYLGLLAGCGTVPRPCRSEAGRIFGGR